MRRGAMGTLERMFALLGRRIVKIIVFTRVSHGSRASPFSADLLVLGWWDAALALNPLHPIGWFSLGFALLKLDEAASQEQAGGSAGDAEGAAADEEKGRAGKKASYSDRALVALTR